MKHGAFHMPKLRIIAAIGFLSTLVFASSVSAGTPSGHIDWHEWSFDWRVEDDRDSGLGILNVHFNGLKIISRANMPVTRVQYYGGEHGPYADEIDASDLLGISNCLTDPGTKVCIQSFQAAGTDWLKISILAKIGAYRLNQQWYFSRTGIIDARLFSRGIHAPVNHHHHPHWRIDFAVNGESGDEFWIYEGPSIPMPWGNTWVDGQQVAYYVQKPLNPPAKVSLEGNFKKDVWVTRRWFVRDNQTGLGVWVFPGPNELDANAFATFDVATRRFHNSENVDWEFDCALQTFDCGGLGYLNGESTEPDLIVWGAGHILHRACCEEDDWHPSELRLQVHTPPVVNITTPTQDAQVAYGGFNFVEFNVTTTSPVQGEDWQGQSCCKVTWTSSNPADIGPAQIPGQLGKGNSIYFTFPNPGTRTVTATAEDITGLTTSDQVTIKVGNVPPQVTILQPQVSTTIHPNLPTPLVGAAIDYNEPGMQLPCNAFEWTSSNGVDPFPVAGCLANVTFGTAGARVLTLTGTDSDSAMGTDQVIINVIGAPSTSGPLLSISSPIEGDLALWDPGQTWPLTGTINDPSVQGSLQYEWTVITSAGETTLGTGTTPPSQETTIVERSWKPSDNVAFNCGGNWAKICLYATNAAQNTKFICNQLTVAYPPC